MRLKEDRQYKEDKRGNEIEGQTDNTKRTKGVMRLKEDKRGNEIEGGQTIQRGQKG